MPNKEARLPVVLGMALVVTCTFSALIAAEAVGRPKARTAADLRESTGRKYSALEQDWLFQAGGVPTRDMIAREISRSAGRVANSAASREVGSPRDECGSLSPAPSDAEGDRSCERRCGPGEEP